MKTGAMKTVATLAAGLLLLPAAAHAAGMPQLDFSTPLTISQVVWGAIIFIVLYVLLAKGGLPKVASVLDERAARISADLDAARVAKAKADADADAARAAHEKARNEALGAINSAVSEAKAAAAAQSEALNARLEKQLKDAEAQIAQARAASLGAVRQVATEAATVVVSRLSGTAVNEAALNQAVSAAMAARGIA
jgi:F-type H+-transporting ATPase subunit b